MAENTIDGFLKRKIQSVQDFSILLGSGFWNIFTSPRYLSDLLAQLDVIGVGSLPIVLPTGFFAGAVLALQTYRTLSTFGAAGLLGEVVSISIVRELGPVFTALMVAGRTSTGTASELGSMLVSEQIDAMRAMGTDPVRKLVTPRLYASLLAVPLLTVLADFSGLLGGYFLSAYAAHLTASEYWITAFQSLTFQDVTQGLLKPLFFAVIVVMVGCFFGLSARGGTEGVGRATTEAMVWASVFIIIVDFTLTKFLIAVGFF